MQLNQHKTPELGQHAVRRPMKQKIKIYAIWWLQKVQQQQTLVVAKRKEILSLSLSAFLPPFRRRWSNAQDKTTENSATIGLPTDLKQKDILKAERKFLQTKRTVSNSFTDQTKTWSEDDSEFCFHIHWSTDTTSIKKIPIQWWNTEIQPPKIVFVRNWNIKSMSVIGKWKMHVWPMHATTHQATTTKRSNASKILWMFMWNCRVSSAQPFSNHTHFQNSLIAFRRSVAGPVYCLNMCLCIY